MKFDEFFENFVKDGSGKVIVSRPIAGLLKNPLAVYYFCEAITSGNAWRYSYARSPDLGEIEIELPISESGLVDYAIMAKIVEHQLNGEKRD